MESSEAEDEEETGKGKGRESQVFLPITTVFPRVVFLKNCKSVDCLQGRSPFFPMTPFRSQAKIIINIKSPQTDIGAEI